MGCEFQRWSPALEDPLTHLLLGPYEKSEKCTGTGLELVLEDPRTFASCSD